MFAVAGIAGAAESYTPPATNSAKPVLIELVLTRYLDNISPTGGYTQVKFTNTSGRAFKAIAFAAVAYADGKPILQTIKNPVVFGAKGDFRPGETYTVTSEKPVWPGPWKRVNCVHLVGLLLGYADGKSQKIGQQEISRYLRPEIAAQNCSHPSAPGPHN
ncbi:MAG: hypothetical protein ACRESQ_05675 [Gammaproteobacteria bacterium]